MAMITGYTSRLSARPGETFDVMVSTQHPEFHLDIVRLMHGDDDKNGPGVKEAVQAHAAAGEYRGGEQALHPGSAVIIPADDAPALSGDFTAFVWMFPTKVGGSRQTIWSGGDALWLGLGDDGRVACQLGNRVLSLAEPALERVWQWLAVSVFGDEITLSSGLYPGLVTAARDFSTTAKGAACSGSRAPMTFGARLDGAIARDAFNGKLGDPMLFNEALPAPQLRAVAACRNFDTLPASCIAAWDFSIGSTGIDVTDSVGGHHGKTHQSPIRLVTGPHWTHASHPELDRRGYAAMHFHEDLLTNANWTPSITLAIPDDWASGVYAARLTAGADVEYLPFFVCPPRHKTGGRVALLMPTFTYMAYGNEMWEDYGLNCVYDYYVDGSGVPMASSLHPMKTLRPGRGLLKSVTGERFARHLCADLYFVDWADQMGIELDILTDHDLHREGVELLAGYRAVVTGSHPEYVSAQMLDGLEAYLGQGGSIAYLGGNGFYSVTSLSSDASTIEVRRPNGTRPSSAEPGEGFHAFTGERGGIWRQRGRAPQRLVGVGFTAQGWTSHVSCGLPQPYQQAERQTDLARELLDGIDPDAAISDFQTLGLGHGAAGDEIDRVDLQLGTPPQTIMLATATGFSSDYQLVIEERRDVNEASTLPGDPKVRADIACFETPAGGLVFAVGSMQWFSALSHNGYDNDVSRLTQNVLRRMVR